MPLATCNQVLTVQHVNNCICNFEISKNGKFVQDIFCAATNIPG